MLSHTVAWPGTKRYSLPRAPRVCRIRCSSIEARPKAAVYWHGSDGEGLASLLHLVGAD